MKQESKARNAAVGKQRKAVAGKAGRGVVSRKRVRFEISAQSGSRVFVSGGFNSWKPAEKPLKERGSTGIYSAVLYLPKGRHEYKFVINDIWVVDPNCSEWVPNGYGSLNSVVEVD